MADNPVPQGCNLANMATRDMIISPPQTNNINCTYVAITPSSTIPQKLHYFLPSSPYFHGRETELTSLKIFLQSRKSFEKWYEKTVIISGLGGMGKSEIVKVLLEEVKKEFNYIFWFNAQSKESLETSFAQLLYLLNAQTTKEEKSPFHLASKAYNLLEEHFSKTIFIFDNAELLEFESNSYFEFEKYLLPEFPCKKPVFIVTTRDKWHRLEHESKIQIIPLYEVSDDDARVCFIKYLRIEGLKIEDSLSETIDKLVHIVQGHPLGIFLMGTEAARQENEISFGGVETRISNYLRLLDKQPQNSLVGQEKYEANLQIIFDERMRKLEEKEGGKDALKIVSILSLLSPDEIYVGLVNGIFAGKNFYPLWRFCDRFLVADSDWRVERALNLLQYNSLIRIESVKIPFSNFDLIRIHRLVQRCAGRSESVLLQLTHTFQLAAHFFATNEDTVGLRGHILSILLSVEETTISLENSDVLSLIFEFTSEHPSIEEIIKVFRFLYSREWNDGENRVVSIMKNFAEPISETKRFRERELKKIKDLMLGLPKEFIRREWIIQLCTRVLSKYFVDIDGTDLMTLRSWLKKCYLKCPSVCRYTPGLLKWCFFRANYSVFDADDEKIVLKVFSNTSERYRSKFWLEMALSIRTFMGLVPYFFPRSGETNLFVKTLEFPTTDLKMDFFYDWAEIFEDCVKSVMENEEMREKLLGTLDFARALKDITEFGFNKITQEFGWETAFGILNLLLIWLGLFSVHKPTYETFGGFVDGLVNDVPESTKSKLSVTWNSCIEIPYKRFNELSLELTSLAHCSTVTKAWIQTFSILYESQERGLIFRS